jgi:PAS domain S-box-containing protein
MANQALQQMLGYTEEELKTKQVKDLVCSDDQSAIADVFDSWNATQEKGAHATLHRFLHKSGATVYIQMNASTAVDSDGKPSYVILILSDVSERLRLELELRQAQKLESVGRLAAGIAHEVNTPIQFIGDNTRFVRSAFTDLFTLCDCYREVLEVLRDQVTKDQVVAIQVAEESADLEYLRANVGPALASTLDGVDRVSGIVKAMKSFAHPDRMEKSPTDLTAALQSTLIVAANELKYVATIETDFCSLPLVNCYESDLNQVFLNLLINAAHAIADVVGSSGEMGTIRIRTYQDDTDIVIAIGDTGTGIPMHAREHIFEPFYTTKEVGRGSGQGLAISRAVVERHGGTLTFETEVGKGTTFFIRFPHGLPAAESKA